MGGEGWGSGISCLNLRIEAEADIPNLHASLYAFLVVLGHVKIVLDC